jgi:BirA family biotin operon repressor/biotin-[acetyl-CoA-carboxylase] ligase
LTPSASATTDVPGPLDPERLFRAYRAGLKRVLRASRLGRPFRFCGEVTSTNDLAREWAGSGAPEGTLVVASSQTKGRGRAGRTWVSGPGAGLWLSLVLRPELAHPSAGLLPVALGFGVVAALRELGPACDLKWPNDVLWRGRKLAGLLVESQSRGDRVSLAVAGIGLNWIPPDLGGDSERATGLVEAFSGNAPSPEAVLARVLDQVEKAYFLLKAAGPRPFVKAWPGVSAGLGRQGETVLAERLLPDGSLEVLSPGGKRERMVSGETGSLGPADPRADRPSPERT